MVSDRSAVRSQTDKVSKINDSGKPDENPSRIITRAGREKNGFRLCHSVFFSGAAGAGTVVALQAIGGAAGNMICVHNVVAASATVGLVNREGEIIRMTLIPMTYYIVQGGFIGLALLAGGFNMWWIAAVIWGSAVLLVMSRNRGRASNPVAVRS